MIASAFGRISVLALGLFVTCHAFADTKKRDTIKSLEKRTVELRPGRQIIGSSSLARDNYRAFLDLVSDDPDLRAEVH